jgi:hypothetical protein
MGQLPHFILSFVYLLLNIFKLIVNASYFICWYFCMFFNVCHDKNIDEINYFSDIMFWFSDLNQATLFSSFDPKVRVNYCHHSDTVNIYTKRGCRSQIYNYLCNQCPSLLTLWVSVPLMGRYTRYNIMWKCLSATSDRFFVFSGFLHQLNWLNNISVTVESGNKHHNPNPQICSCNELPIAKW